MSNLSKEDFDFLAFKAYQIRRDSIRATTAAKSGHPTSCLSASDIVSTLFFKEMSYDPQNPHKLNNDRLVLSKGHAIPVIYAAWKNVGLISDEDLLSLRKVDSPFEGTAQTLILRFALRILKNYYGSSFAADAVNYLLLI